MRFTCEAGARITSKSQGSLASFEATGKSDDRWERHYGNADSATHIASEMGRAGRVPATCHPGYG